MAIKLYSVEDIQNDKKMVEFLVKKKAHADCTKDNYIYRMRDFCNFVKLSPSEIFKLHKKDLEEHTPEFGMWLNSAFDSYVAYLIDADENYSLGTIQGKVRNVKTFLHAFKLKPTPTPEISKKAIKEDFKYALKVEDIRKALKNCTPTHQTLFILQAQTGLSISDALLLNIEDFVLAVSKKGEKLTVQEAIFRAKNDNIIGCFDLRRKKTTIDFYTFASPETIRSIALLIEERDESLLRPKCPIFMKNSDRLPRKNKELWKDLRLKPKVVQNYIDRMHKRKKVFERIVVGDKERNFFTTHKLRKWFSNQLMNEAQFNLIDTKYLMGQKIGDVAERYYNPNNYNALKNRYRKALPHLAITEEVVMEENLEAIEDLQNKNEELKKQLQQQNEQHQCEIAEMRELIESATNDTKKLVYDVLKNSKSLNTDLNPEDLPSGEKILDSLGSAILKARKDELNEKKN